MGPKEGLGARGHRRPGELQLYLAGLGRYPLRGYPNGRLPPAASGVLKLADLLRARGAMPTAAPVRSAGAGDALLAAFQHHLVRVVGTSVGTCRMYGRYASALLVDRFGGRDPDWSTFGADDVSHFVRSQAAKLKPSACRPPVTATRAFLRFLVSQGLVRDGLAGAIPTVPQWRHASLPHHLSTKQATAVVAKCSTATAVGRRDRAIVIMMVRLGIRVSDVASLRA